MNTSPNKMTAIITAIALAAGFAVPTMAQCSKSSGGSCSTIQPVTRLIQPQVIPRPPFGTTVPQPPYFANPGSNPGSNPGGSNFGNSNKVFQCEVQVQHPISFTWQTVRSFGDVRSANQYKTAIESRYVIVYLRPGSDQPSLLEAVNQQDANAKTDGLKLSGSVIRDVRSLRARVVEESLQALLNDNSGLFDQQASLQLPQLQQPPQQNPSASPQQPQPSQQQQPLNQPSEQPVDQNQLMTSLASFAQSDTESAVDNALLPLMGLWQAVTKDAEGQTQRVLLNLEATGFATLTIPNADGGDTSINRKFAVENDQLNLIDGENRLTLGRILSADAEKVELVRAEGKITFVRP